MKMKQLNKKNLVQLMTALVFVLTLAFCVQTRVSAANLSAPTNIVQTGSSTTSVAVQWDTVFGNGEKVHYLVQVSETADFARYVESDAYYSTYDTVNGLAAGKTYYLRAGAYVGTKTSVTWSQPVKVVTTPDSVNKNTVKYTNATETSITVAWGAVSGATHYRVIYYESSASSDAAATATATTNSIVLKNLKKNTNYNVYIYPWRMENGCTYQNAIANYGYGFSNLPTLPTKVTGLSCTYFSPDVSKGYANFQIDKNTVADGYQYEIYAYNGKKKLTSGYVSKYSYNLFGVETSKIKKRQYYKIRVRGYVNTTDNKKKYGKWSSYANFARCSGSDVSAKLTGKRIKVSWKKVGGATNYTVYMATKYNGKYKKVGTTKKTSLTIKQQVKSGNNYYLRIVPNRKSGKANYKAVVNSKDYYAKSVFVYTSYRYY